MLSKLTALLNHGNEAKIQLLIKSVEENEAEVSNYSDLEIKCKIHDFKDRIKRGESLERILPEAFAVCREASKRTLGMRHYDVQVHGAIVLHNGFAAEMKTGEGKTLVASMPAYLNACAGKKVYIVTANDYLAERDAGITSPLFESLGLSTSAVISSMNSAERKLSYQADIIYSTASQLGFDFLRDSTAVRAEDMIQGKLHYAIIDEIDSILIDDARTPLIITHPGKTTNEHYQFFNEIIGDFTFKAINKDCDPDDAGENKDHVHLILNRKDKTCEITEHGYNLLELKLIEKGIISNKNELYTHANLQYIDMLSNAAKAHHLFIYNFDYIVSLGKAHIVDQNTGRISVGRRWSGGLHQAIEAKEGIEIQPDNINDGSISLQNYFKLFDKLSGMSGTVLTEKEEFEAIYGMSVVVIPTNKPLIRVVQPDRVYLKSENKNKAVIQEIVSIHKTGRPILVGTQSIEESEAISGMLKKSGIQHRLLNASKPEKEALIIADAGKIGAITIATNIAGRGTDIILGGNIAEFMKHVIPSEIDNFGYLEEHAKIESQKIKELGGLHVIGTSRSKSRRIDNQLIGRCGRQGEPGSAVIFSSLEDDLLMFFGAEKYIRAFRSIGVTDEDCISHSMIDKAIHDAQKKHEGAAAEMRATLVKYDNVSHEQRFHYTKLRNMFLEDKSGTVLKEIISNVIPNAYFDSVFNSNIAHIDFPEYWDTESMSARLKSEIGMDIDVTSIMGKAGVFEPNVLKESIRQLVCGHIDKSIIEGDLQSRPEYLKQLLMECIHDEWIDNINHLEEIRAAINLRGYAQKDPLREYKEEAIKRFEIFTNGILVKFLPKLYQVSIHAEAIMRANDALKQIEDDISTK